MTGSSTYPSQPIREAKQSRSRMLMQSVREATLALITDEGVDAVTTVKIAERAGISPGSLYRYYPNKQAIFTDIYNCSLAELDRKFGEITPVSTTGLEEGLRFATKTTLHFYRDLLSVHRDFFSAYHEQFDFTLRKNPENQQAWDSVGLQWFIGLLEENRHRLRHDDLEGAADFLFCTATGYFHRIIATEPGKLDDDSIIERLMDLMVRYLVRD